MPWYLSKGEAWWISLETITLFRVIGPSLTIMKLQLKHSFKLLRPKPNISKCFILCGFYYRFYKRFMFQYRMNCIGFYYHPYLRGLFHILIWLNSFKKVSFHLTFSIEGESRDWIDIRAGELLPIKFVEGRKKKKRVRKLLTFLVATLI